MSGTGAVAVSFVLTKGRLGVKSGTIFLLNILIDVWQNNFNVLIYTARVSVNGIGAAHRVAGLGYVALM